MIMADALNSSQSTMLPVQSISTTTLSPAEGSPNLASTTDSVAVHADDPKTTANSAIANAKSLGSVSSKDSSPIPTPSPMSSLSLSIKEKIFGPSTKKQSVLKRQSDASGVVPADMGHASVTFGPEICDRASDRDSAGSVLKKHFII
jgi:hypothetical protein